MRKGALPGDPIVRARACRRAPLGYNVDVTARAAPMMTTPDSPARRRVAIAAALAPIAAAGPSFAAPVGRTARIGLLCHELSVDWVRVRLGQALAELGYAEGRNYVFEARSSQGRPERLDALAAELVAARVDLAVAPLNREVQAMRRASSTIPILMMYGLLPVETGLVASLARPGGNVTGTTTSAPELMGKMIEVLRAAFPSLGRITWVAETDYPGMPAYIEQFERSARAMGMKVDARSVRDLAEVDAVLAAFGRERPEAVSMSVTGPLLTHAQRVIDFALQARLPLMTSTDMTARGALLAYAPDFTAMLQRNAWMIDRILNGKKPADMPVELPARYRLQVNLRTARAIGVTLPQALLLRADGVIE